MMDLPRRGRPKKTAPSGPSIPVPQVEEFHSGSDDEEIFVGNFQQEDKILVGFKSKVNNQKKIFQWPFGPKKQDKEAILSEYRAKISFFMQKTDELLTNSDSINKYDYYPGNDIYSSVLIIANDNKSSCDKIHEDICTKLTVLANHIPLDMKGFNDAIEIGEYWKQVISKIRLITTSWSPLCQKERNLHDFKTVFKNHLSKVFENTYENLFSYLSEIIVNAYAEARESKDVTQIKHAFEFVCYFDNNLFDHVFMPMFINSIIQHYEPILDHHFINYSLSEYLKISIEIKEAEEELIKPLISNNALKWLENAFNMLIFGNEERFNIICKNLAPLIQQKDSESIQKCADFARSTDKINSFARELSFEFESEAEKCFKMENPIKAIMKLHLSLSEFDNFFNEANKRNLRSSFEKGFNTSPDTAAELLTEEIHNEFTKKENNHKMCPKEIIDQLVAVFRMIASKDVFEAKNHTFLIKRILMNKSHILEADKYFTSALREQCGPEYTKRFENLFSDLEVSIATYNKFVQAKRPPPFFKAIVLSNESMRNFNLDDSIVPPEDIKILLNSFTQFYIMENEKKKLQWDFNYTKVKLISKNLGLIKTIHCNGTLATFLLMFNNNRSLYKEYFKKIGNFSDEKIDNIVNNLQSKKCNHFLLVMHNKIHINKDQFAIDDEASKNNDEIGNKFSSCTNFDYKSGDFNIPIIFPPNTKTDNDKQKSAIQSNRQMQVEAAVMKVMKNERSMEKIDLKNTVKELLNFRLEDEFFESRLDKLSKTLYLKLDPSGRVHYLT